MRGKQSKAESEVTVIEERMYWIGIKNVYKIYFVTYNWVKHLFICPKYLKGSRWTCRFELAIMNRCKRMLSNFHFIQSYQLKENRWRYWNPSRAAWFSFSWFRQRVLDATILWLLPTWPTQHCHLAAEK